MTPRILIFLLSLVTLVSGGASDNEPQVIIADLRDYSVGFRYLYRMPRSALAALPKWTPTEGEVPLSPHRAASIATEHLSRQFPNATKLAVFSMSLQRCGTGRDFEKPELNGIWAYQVAFNSEPQPKPEDKALLNVMVLLDGTVVKPEITPLK